MNGVFKYVGLGLAGLLSACVSGTPAPITEGAIKQNWLGQDGASAPVPVLAAQNQTGLNPSAAMASVRPFSQPIAPLYQEEELSAVAPAAGPVTRSAHAQQTLAPRVAAPTPTNETYTVQAQDTLYRIARTHNTTPQAIMTANNLRDIADLQPGRTLTIPANLKSGSPSLAESIQAYLSTPVAPVGAISAPPLAAAVGEVPIARPAVPVVESTAAIEPQKVYEMARLEPAAGNAKPELVQAREGAAVQHRVGTGETIYRISKAYGVSVLDIMAANDLAKPEALQAGILVNIPASGTMELGAGTGAVKVASVSNGSALRPATELGVTETTRATIAAQAAMTGTTTTTDMRPAYDPDKGTDTAGSVQPLRDVKPMTDTERMKAELKRGVIDKTAAAQSGLIWPARGAVVKRFGEKGNGVAYTGINIEVPVGTPVLATEAGTVLYAADGLRTYGQMVLLRHSNGMVSAYAHNSHLLVRKGEKVRKGQIVAMSGQSGNAGSPQLHFELRRNAVALDPLKVLPKI